MGAEGHQPKSSFSISTPWYYGWNIIGVTLLIQGITIGLMTYCFTLWISPFKEEFGAAQGTILLAASLSNASMGVISPIAGRLMDRLSMRLMLIIGMVIFGIGYFLVSVSTAIWQVIALYATLLPLGVVLAGPLSSQIMVARWFEKNRGVALGISSVGTSIGGVLLPPIVATLDVSIGWRMTHVMIAVAAVVIVVPVVLLFVRNRTENDMEPGKSRKSKGNEDVSLPPHVFPDWKTKDILKSKTLWILVSFLGPMMFAMTSVAFNIAPISEAVGINVQHAALMVSTYSLTMIGGKLAYGFLADRIEHKIVVWLAAIMMLVCLILLQVASNIPSMLTAMVFLGLASGGMMPIVGVIIASRFGAPNFGRVNGMLAPFVTAFAFGPVAIGYLRAGLDSWTPIFFLLMFAVIPPIVGAFFLGSAVPEVPKSPDGQAEAKNA